MSSKMIAVVCGLALAQGCMTSYVSSVKKGVSGNPEPGGYYALSGSPISSGRIKTGAADTNDVPARDSALPVNIAIRPGALVDSTSSLAVLNNIFSVCTIGIWPYVSSSEQSYVVTVTPPKSAPTSSEVVVEKSQWSSFILPFAALPYPGSGEHRGFAAGKNTAGSLDAIGQVQCGKEVQAILSEKFYKTEMAKYVAAKQQAHEQYLAAQKLWRAKKHTAAEKIQQMLLKVSKKNRSRGDSRSVVLFDMKDIQDRTSAHSKQNRSAVGGIAAVGEELETMLSRLGFRVLSKRSMGRSLEEKAVFSSLSNNDAGQLDIEIPAYRIEGVVYQYGVEEKNDEKKTVLQGIYQNKKLHKMIGRVELSLKFINIRTGETEYAIPRIKKEVVDTRTTKSVFAKDKLAVTNQGADADPMIPEKILAQALQSTVAAMAQDISIKLKPFHIVECSDDAVLVFDAPAAVVQSGSQMQLYSVSQRRKSHSGKVYRQETPVAVVRVREVNEDSCTAEFVSIDKVDCDWDIIAKPIIKDVATREDIKK